MLSKAEDGLNSHLDESPTEDVTRENKLTSSTDTNLISWIEYPNDNQKLEEYMQLLSTRLLIIEKEKYKLELERQSILQTLWGNNHLLSHLNNNKLKVNDINLTSLHDRSELIPLNHRKLHNFNKPEILNEIKELSTPKRFNEHDKQEEDKEEEEKEALFDNIDFSKLDLDTLNSILFHFGIKRITNDEFDQGVELLVRIRAYLMDNGKNSGLKPAQVTPAVKDDIDELLNSR